MTEKEIAIRGSKYYREFQGGDGLTHDEGEYDASELSDEDDLDECGDN